VLGLGLVAGTVLALVSSASRGDMEGAEGPYGRAVAWAQRRRGAEAALLILGAAALLVGSRLVGGGTRAAGVATVLLSVAGVVLFAVAARRLLPLSSRLVGAARREVPDRLAGWQVSRRPQQHAGLVFLLVLAVTLGTFSALSAALGLRHGRDPASQGVLLVGSAAAMLVAVVAFALHFVGTARRRLQEYAALLLSGLPVGAVRRSLAVEQRMVLSHSLLAGALVGLALALVLLPTGELRADLPTGALALAAALAGFLALALIVAWTGRRTAARIDLGKELRLLV
jgi:hypothetical protein